MKLKIDTKIIAELNPCTYRFDNWKEQYGNKTYDALEFLELENITHSDKLWVLLRLVPRSIVETFAIDCAVHAATYDANYIADVIAAATYGANAAEHARQLDALAYLISTEEES